MLEYENLANARFVLPCVLVILWQAEELINNGFPRRIVELNDLLSTPLFSTKNLEDVHEDLKVPIPEPVLSNKYDIHSHNTYVN